MSSTQRQLEKIAQFKAVTSIDSDEIARRVLEQSDWNLDIGISRFYENPNSFFHGETAQTAQTGQTGENGQNGQNGQNRQNRQNEQGREEANVNGNYGGWMILNIFNMICSIISSLFGLINSFNVFHPRVRYDDIYREFIDEYGNELNFFANLPFRQVMEASQVPSDSNNDVALSNNRAIFIYFYQKSNRMCETVNRNILSKQEVIDYLRVNFTCWLGDLRSDESKQLYQQVTRQWGDRRLPFVAICGVDPSSGRLLVVYRQHCRSNSTWNDFVSNVLVRGNDKWQNVKLKIYSDALERSQSRIVRQQQDDEYERLLKEEEEKSKSTIDQVNLHDLNQRNDMNNMNNKNNMNNNGNGQGEKSKEKFANEEISMQDKEQEKMNKLIEEKCQIALSRMCDEPCANESDTNKLVKIAMRLPGGTLMKRNFLESDKIEMLFCWIGCHAESYRIDDEYVQEWEIRCNYPRQTLSTSDSAKTLKELSICGSATLFVEAC